MLKTNYESFYLIINTLRIKNVKDKGKFHCLKDFKNFQNQIWRLKRRFKFNFYFKDTKKKKKLIYKI